MQFLSWMQNQATQHKLNQKNTKSILTVQNGLSRQLLENQARGVLDFFIFRTFFFAATRNYITFFQHAQNGHDSLKIFVRKGNILEMCDKHSFYFNIYLNNFFYIF